VLRYYALARRRTLSKGIRPEVSLAGCTKRPVHQLLQVVEALQERFPAVPQLLLDAEGEVLTFYDFPPEHRRQVHSTNPLERLNKELKRRSAVVGIFPNRQAVLRLFEALLAEQNYEWLVSAHRYMSETSLRTLFIHAAEDDAPT